MKKARFIAFLILLINLICNAQDSPKSRYVISIPPIKSFTDNPINRTYGLSLGFWNMPVSGDLKVHGVNFELIGYGWLAPFLGMDDGNSFQTASQDINGFSIGGLTLLNIRVNGISFAPLLNVVGSNNGLQLSFFNANLSFINGVQLGVINYAQKSNGASLGLINFSRVTNGIQVGLFNKSNELHGIQIGLININQKRKIPIINWAF